MPPPPKEIQPATPPPVDLDEQQRIEAAHAEAAACRASFEKFARVAWQLIDPEPLVDNWHIRDVCLHLEALARGEMTRLLINIPPRHGKPVWEEEPVTERTRGRIRLAEVKVGDEVLTHRGRYRRVAEVSEQGELPLLKVTTHCGRQVRTAYDHPYLTTRGWIRADQLKERDVLASVNATERAGTVTVTPEEARLLGYLVGDGHIIHPQRASFTNADPETLDDFERCAASAGFRTHRARMATSKQNASPKASIIVLLPICPAGLTKWHESTRGPHPVWSWLERHGLKGKNSYTKRVPAAICAASEHLIAEFVGAYWSCDGSVAMRGGSRTDCRVSATSVSEGLARDLQHLLVRHGIQSRIRRKESAIKTKRQGDIYVSWNVEITSVDDAALFGEKIPMRHSKKTPLIRRYDRVAFNRTLREDTLVSVQADGSGKCRCLTVEEDESFTAGDLVVHNSNLFAILWPAWVWTWWPEAQFLFLSYAAELSVEHSVKCRQVIESAWYQDDFAGPAGWHLRDDQNVKHDFANTVGGRRRATSIGGNVTGHGGDIIGIDDPLNAEDAYSAAARTQARRVIAQVIATRLNHASKGLVGMIMQRLHEEDPSGFVLEGGLGGWQNMRLPSEFEADERSITYRLVDGERVEFWRDPRKVDGELLFPARFPAAVLAVMKAPNALGADGFSGQHQQRPTAAKGNMYEKGWWRFWKPDGTAPDHLMTRPKHCYEGPARPLPVIEKVILSVDASFKETKSGSFVAIHAWGKAGPDRFLLGRIHARMDFDDTCKAIETIIRQFPRALEKVIELKANGDAIVNQLSKKFPGFIGVTPEGGKEARAYATQPYVKGGNVYLPDGAPWLDAYISEHAAFPLGKWNDDVDAQSQALTYLEEEATTAELWSKATL